jgi:hypothetical protein
MSTPSQRTDRITLPALDRSVERLFDAVAAPLRFVGFWAAVAMPFLYLPLLFGGLTGGEAVVFAALLATNVLSLVVGHGYRADA